MTADIVSLLEANGIRPSVQRLMIYAYLAERKNHPTVDTIYMELNLEIPTLSKTTVYNTLKLFIENGLIQPLPIEGEEIRYDADISPHLHFKCTVCGIVYDMQKQPQNTYSLPDGFICRREQHFMWGVCPSCG